MEERRPRSGTISKTDDTSSVFGMLRRHTRTDDEIRQGRKLGPRHCQLLPLDLPNTGIEREKARMVAISLTRRSCLSRMTPQCFLWTLLGCWECFDCWCRRTDSEIASNRPDIDCCFGLVVLNAAVFDCRIVNRPLSKQFLASLTDAL
ncbi:hypothetical protein BLNAU_20878 [Blattamonas nauphoetae]|uniref:Uncharacterized protein n=1 Tax=Blattamonas nauphoetae TaxID=2049346 RepID=A0ABQ9WXH1_9EUKA|nr:hypothetical protein BLNAU_20878 [Blattamonas nauphoetae]